jgi:hypothetical protein
LVARQQTGFQKVNVAENAKLPGARRVRNSWNR